MNLITSWWAEILAGLAIIAAFISAYFGGKKIGSTQTQARADVAAAQVESKQVADVAKQQSENTEKANEVRQSNAALSDDDQRNKLRQSQFNSDD
ncbi:hypothetical protein [Pantoea vagans]|uniref:hypothetical protein n=1 Tax=Pantoea vagans TaxID=470934 RepID=UPI00366E96AC